VGLKGTRAEFLALKESARRLVHERIAHFCTIYPFVCNRVSIRNQGTRWGSCSKKGNLNFHYRIALLPEHLRDYVIVHELCHLGEFNHSRNFWDLVARAVPNHKALRAELCQHAIDFKKQYAMEQAPSGL
jgi:predicted metal-dependent hydrolase